MKKMQTYFVNALLFGVLINSTCSLAATDSTTPEVLITTPSIVGQVTAIALPMVIVEENPAESHGSDKARVRVTDGTQVLRQGEVVGIAELQVGQQVKVWFTGPVMESYPAQATASVIVIVPTISR